MNAYRTCVHKWNYVRSSCPHCRPPASVYKSFTHGAIPLNGEARRLMQTLRFAIRDAIRAGDYSAKGNAVASARGELAKHISKLEKELLPKFPPSDGLSGSCARWFICDEVATLKPFKSWFGIRDMVADDIGWESLTPEQSRIRALERKVQKRLKRARK